MVRRSVFLDSLILISTAAQADFLQPTSRKRCWLTSCWIMMLRWPMAVDALMICGLGGPFCLIPRLRCFSGSEFDWHTETSIRVSILKPCAEFMCLVNLSCRSTSIWSAQYPHYTFFPVSGCVYEPLSAKLFLSSYKPALSHNSPSSPVPQPSLPPSLQLSQQR